jgi:hypothetical protein
VLTGKLRTLGFASVDFSFLRYAENAAQHYDTRSILLKVGHRGLVGGQEDMIVDIALDLAAACDPVAPPSGVAYSANLGSLN